MQVWAATATVELRDAADAPQVAMNLRSNAKYCSGASRCTPCPHSANRSSEHAVPAPRRPSPPHPAASRACAPNISPDVAMARSFRKRAVSAGQDEFANAARMTHRERLRDEAVEGKPGAAIAPMIHIEDLDRINESRVRTLEGTPGCGRSTSRSLRNYSGWLAGGLAAQSLRMLPYSSISAVHASLKTSVSSLFLNSLSEVLFAASSRRCASWRISADDFMAQPSTVGCGKPKNFPSKLQGAAPCPFCNYWRISQRLLAINQGPSSCPSMDDDAE
jgi:hypothetical protein